MRASWLVPVALGALGAAVRIGQYAAGASLWADEANLALNIIDRPLGRLLGPLDDRQMAPPGWLLLEKAAVLLLGDGENGLALAEAHEYHVIVLDLMLPGLEIMRRLRTRGRYAQIPIPSARDRVDDR